MTTVDTSSRAKTTAHAAPTRPTLVVFFDARSGASRRFDGYLAQVLQRRGNHDTFRILRVDAEERPDLVERFSVQELPTLVVVSQRRVRAQMSKPRGCVEISELLAPWLR